LVTEMLDDPGVRLPGSRRDALAAAAARNGIDIAQGLADDLARWATA